MSRLLYKPRSSYGISRRYVKLSPLWQKWNNSFIRIACNFIYSSHCWVFVYNHRLPNLIQSNRQNIVLFYVWFTWDVVVCRYWPREGGCWEYFGIPYVSVCSGACDEEGHHFKAVSVNRYMFSVFEEKILWFLFYVRFVVQILTKIT